jgi:hypothetical protein
MSRGVPLLLLVLGLFIAFWAGGKWRHFRRAWSDHKIARAAEKNLRGARWIAARTAFVAVIATLLYLVASGVISVNVGKTSVVPARLQTPSGAPSSRGR